MTVFRSQDRALLQFSQIQRFEKPDDTNLKLLQEWLDRPEGGDFFLRGREADIWESDKDLIALSRRQADKDCITHFISDVLIPWYHHRWGNRVKVLPSSDHQKILQLSPCAFDIKSLPRAKTGTAYGTTKKLLLLLSRMPSALFSLRCCQQLRFWFCTSLRTLWQD